MNKPWSTVDDEELKLLRLVAEEALDIFRGCSCEYDYRCNNCEQILLTKELARKALGKTAE